MLRMPVRKVSLLVWLVASVSALPTPLANPTGGAPSGAPNESSASSTGAPAPERTEVVFERHGEVLTIVTRGLPAVSADGRQVAYVSTFSGYDESFNSELHIASLQRSSVKRFVLD